MDKALKIILFAILFAVPANASITVVQATGTGYANMSSGNATVAMTGVTGGNALCAGVVQEGATSPVSLTVTDGGDTFNIAAVPFFANGGDTSFGAQLTCATGVAGGNPTVSVPFPATGAKIIMVVVEISGLLSSPLDQHNSNNDNGSFGATLSVSTVTTTVNNEIVMALGTISAADTYTQGSGYTIPSGGQIKDTPNSQSIAFQYKILATAGATGTVSMVASGGGRWNIGLATMKPQLASATKAPPMIR